MIKHLAIIITLLIIACVQFAHAAQKLETKTIIHDQKEADLLLGKHLFTNEKLCCRYIASYQFFGESIVYENDGLYHIHGGHDGYFRFKSDYYHGGYLRMDGTISEINTESFLFQGTVETAELDQNKWLVCPRTGTFEFSRKNHPAYWRFHPINYPEHCSNRLGDGEAIDLFSKQIFE